MNPIVFDESLLKELGLDGFDEEDKNAILKKLYESLELRLGMRMARELGEEKLGEFQKLAEAGQDKEAADWLKQNVPNYHDIAAEELQTIKDDIKATSRTVLENNV